MTRPMLLFVIAALFGCTGATLVNLPMGHPFTTFFQAARTTSILLKDRPVTYDRVFIQSSDHSFDGTTFTAPRRGLYLFLYSGGRWMANSPAYMDMVLNVNGVTVNSIWTGQGLTDTTVSGQQFLMLNRGDKVTVNLNGVSYSSSKVYPGYETTFGGVMLVNFDVA